jgi:MoCo/4Fe-4S cofactor protein with predicted Tat translocation signal
MNHALWRSLEQAAADPLFLARAAQEFPGLARALREPLERRQVLKLMAAAFVMTGLAGCGDSTFGENLIPAVKMPPNIIPGLPNFYTTAHVLDGYATGIVVEHMMGRPIKVAGNPKHPASLGAIDVFAQAQLLDFYDPDRAAQINERGIPSDAQRLQLALDAERQRLARTRGAGLRILTGTITSPTLARQLTELRAKYPEAQWVQWEPLGRDALRQGAIAAYGKAVEVIAHLDRVDVLLGIDSDLLSTAPGRLRHTRDFASRRNPSRTATMSRIYAVEPTPTLLGSVADHRFVAGPSELPHLMAALGAGSLHAPPSAPAPSWVGAVVADLKAAQGRAFVHVGAQQPPEMHAWAHAMNEALGGRGTTYELIEPVASAPSSDQTGSLRALVADMRAGHVTHLLMIDSNPVYGAPATFGFAEALKQVPFSLALANTTDETARSSTWYVPRTHDWESWSDARAYDGTVTLLQPQALPLFGGMSAHELLSLYLDAALISAEESVRLTWMPRLDGDFMQGWAQALANGVVAGTASDISDVRLRPPAVDRLVGEATAEVQLDTAPGVMEPHGTVTAVGLAPDSVLTILFRADPSLWDGRFANNPWLQELPRPLTKLVWDNPLLIAPALAQRLQLTNGDCVRLSINDSSVVAPVWILPGQAPECVTALLGSGRLAAGSIGNAIGVDYYPLTGVKGSASLKKQKERVDLASTVHHNLLMQAPDEVLRHGTLAQFRANPHFAAGQSAEPHLYRTVPPGPAAWAMSVDLNGCIGCNACIIACQAENNIPVVGKTQVLNEREMHWLRIDRYFEGEPEAPESFFQPVLCMHCEEAPCENVCPVGATVHDSEGLNVMVYNRCVGTRFCSNNCPYKVRRFNFFGYGDEQHRPPQSWNPDVTVRARGVMEKCSYCVQRIAEARIVADRESLPVGDVKTACQAACPAQVFTFGNLADPDSEVSTRKRSPLDFAMLESQATRPRTTYEALVRNPNPAIKERGS